MTSNLSQEFIAELGVRFRKELGLVQRTEDVDVVRRDWLGKEGTIRELLKGLRDVPVEQKPMVAAGLNALREEVERECQTKEQLLKEAQLQERLSQQYLDLSLPGATPGLGAAHPVTLVEERITAILKPFGFVNIAGPEVETEYFCFDSLNVPKHHPARDMQDTFYTDTGHLLRTHTSSVQSRVMQQRALFEGGRLPIKVASLGRVYRNETEDASHQSMFHQYELLWIEPGLTLSHLMGLITHILKELYGQRRKVRFVPKFYPYTEPSIGPQIDCVVCKGEGCSACGGAGWATVAGGGMVHVNLLREFKFDPEKVSGFAFGLGTSRLAAQMYGFPHLRAVYENDLRLLKSCAAMRQW